MNHTKTIILMGPQGCGKGTQAQLLIPQIGAQYLEAGAILREVAKTNTEFGRKVKALVNSGALVDDETWKQAILGKFEAMYPNKPIIIDGSPRRMGQAHIILEYLRSTGRPDIITIYLSLPRAESIRRLQARRICEGCSKPSIHGVHDTERACAACGGHWVMRKDDTDSAAINRRLDMYEKDTKPVLDFLRKETEFHEIDGRQSISAIHDEIDRVLGLPAEHLQIPAAAGQEER